MAKTGIIKDTYPPGNTGKDQGAGRIVEDGTNAIFIFQTPDDVTAVGNLVAGQKIKFDSGNGKTASGVTDQIGTDTEAP